ncbi:MAG: prephenate dehydrogenase/arogenate dehydrogenase family protein [bacterium]|nr:prephenate dehydrogenase/arogenate dehydrogenase family protein [bacterium]
MKKIGIMGLGIIGGSLALSFKERGYIVVGMNRSREPLEKALKMNIIDETAPLDSPPELDVIFVCTIVSTVPYFIRLVLERTKHTIVTDVASTKLFIIKELEDLPRERLSRFIGGHPMAGSEKTGIDYAKRDLFVNATYFLTPTEYTSETTIATIKDLLEILGANPVFITPEDHDKLVAYISHLPQILSTCLSVVAKSEVNGNIVYSGRGYKDMTRLAHSSFSVWRDILYTNKNNVVEAIEKYIQLLEKVRTYIDNWEEKTIEDIFTFANE